jgi:hypothetical protein
MRMNADLTDTRGSEMGLSNGFERSQLLNDLIREHPLNPRSSAFQFFFLKKG